MIPVLLGLAAAVGLASLIRVPAAMPEPQAAPVTPDKTWKTGRMVLVVGASQSGKTHYVLSEIRNADRLLIWDCEEQYADLPGITVVRRLADLGRILKRAPARFRIAYVPKSMEEFDTWAQWAFFACDCSYLHPVNGERPPTYIVAEEISDTTNPGKAPPGWGQLIRRGLKRNMYLYGITQSPKESDKTFVRNCSEAHVCGVQGEEEPAYLARKLNVPESAIRGLIREKKQFIHKNLISGQVTTGGIVPPRL